MKKMITLALLAALSATLFSCSKKDYSPGNDTVPTLRTTINKVNKVSQWLTINLNSQTVSGASWLQGKHTITNSPNYDHNTHRQFAFMRIAGRDSYWVQSLPTQIPTANGRIDFSYSLDPNTFGLIIKNYDFPGLAPDSQSFFISTSKYRFVVVTDSTFRAHHIDWTDYQEVASALGSSIHFPL
jgi:hypothetical protein